MSLSKEKILNYLIFTWKQLFKATLLFLSINFLSVIMFFLTEKTQQPLLLKILNPSTLLVFYFVINILSLTFILTVIIFHNYSYLMYLSLYPFKKEVKKAKRRYFFIAFLYMTVFFNTIWFFYNLNIEDPIFYLELFYDYMMKMSFLFFILLYIATNNSVKLTSFVNLEQRLYKVYILIFILEITLVLSLYLAYLGLKNENTFFIAYNLFFMPLLIFSLTKLSKEYIKEIELLGSY